MNTNATDPELSKPRGVTSSPEPSALLGRLPITVEALQALEAELQRLRSDRDRHTREVHANQGADAVSHHDVDEAARDARIARIETLLSRTVVVDAGPAADDVTIGSIVTVRDESSGDVSAYEIDGAFAPLGLRISAVSPVGAALLGRKVDDLVRVELPRRRARELRILAVAAGAGATSAG